MNSNGKYQQKQSPYSLSSWNYGAYSLSNPYYKKSQNIVEPKKPITNYPMTSHGKRILKEEEKIVTDEILQNYKDLRVMHGIKPKMKRTKSANIYNRGKNTTTNNNETSNNNNEMTTTNNQITNNNNTNESKTNTSNYRFKLNFDEWAAVKDRQQTIYNKIKKIKEQEDEKMKRINKDVNEKYKEIAEQKYKEWLIKKNKQIREEKRRKKEEEIIKEEEKKKDYEQRKEHFQEWFKNQAEKMEREARIKREEKERQKELEIKNREEEEIRNKNKRETLKQWNKQKDEELKRKKQEEQNKELEEKRKKLEKKQMREIEFQNRKNNKDMINKITIGPYTNAAALREIQKLVSENYGFGEFEEEEEEGEGEGEAEGEGEEGEEQEGTITQNAIKENEESEPNTSGKKFQNGDEGDNVINSENSEGRFQNETY